MRKKDVSLKKKKYLEAYLCDFRLKRCYNRQKVIIFFKNNVSADKITLSPMQIML